MIMIIINGTYKWLNDSKINVKLSNTQLNKLKNAVKCKTGTTLRINLQMLNGNNFPHELLFTTIQKTKLRNAFNNNMSTDLKLSKEQITKIIKSGEFLGSILSKLAGPLMKVAIPLATNFLAPLGITAAALAVDAGITKKKKIKKMHGSGTTNLTIGNEEMIGIMEIVQALEDSDILLKGVTKTTKNETKEQKGGFLSMLLGTLGASLLGNLLKGKGIKANFENKKGKRIVRTGYGCPSIINPPKNKGQSLCNKP